MLSRAVWSGLTVSAILLRILLRTFDTGGALVVGIDEPLKRRQGEKIAAKGIYRDGVRSSKRHFVKAAALHAHARCRGRILPSSAPLDYPLDIVVFFNRRWQMEPTFRHLREHLDMETQRQWSPKAIARITPALLAMFSLVTVLAHARLTRHDLSIRTAAWYTKALPTFADALALVRSRLSAYLTFQLAAADPDMVKVPRALLEHFHDLLAYATSCAMSSLARTLQRRVVLRLYKRLPLEVSPFRLTNGFYVKLLSFNLWVHGGDSM